MKKIDIGISRERFFNERYGKAIYVRRAGVTGHNIDWKHIDASLFGWEPSGREISLYKDGPIEESEYIESYYDISVVRKRLVKDVLYERLNNGATLILNKLNHRSPLVNDLCLEIAQFIGERANANAYVAFGGEGSFGNHWDTHDVFALQILGRKLWRIAPPTFENPLPVHRSKDHKGEKIASIVEMVIEPGDILYVPRGWWHEVVPIDGEESLHLAVGCHPPKILDYLIWLCGNHLTNNLHARSSFNPLAPHEEQLQIFAKAVQTALVSKDLAEEYRTKITEADRVPSRFGIARFVSNNEVSNIDYARISSSFHLGASDKCMFNGFRLNLSTGAQRVLDSIGKTDNQFITTNKELLTKLAEKDVIDIA